LSIARCHLGDCRDRVRLSSFFVAFAFGQILVGPLSDRYGRKWLVLGGLSAFAIGSVVCALSDNLSFLISGRVIQAASRNSLAVC
jgi:DHA1 family bicyclomycin/chloramphenicol resistance-like MFS transporter